MAMGNASVSCIWLKDIKVSMLLSAACFSRPWPCCNESSGIVNIWRGRIVVKIGLWCLSAFV